MSTSLEPSTSTEPLVSATPHPVVEEEQGEGEGVTFRDMVLSEWRSFLPGVALSCLRGLVFPTFAVFYGFMMDAHSLPTEHMLFTVKMYAFWLALLAIWAGGTHFLGSYLVGVSGLGMADRLRLRLFHNIVWQDCAYFDKKGHSAGALVASLNTEPNSLKAAVDIRCSEAINSLTSIAVGMVVAYWVGPQIANIGLIGIAILVVSTFAVALILKRRSVKDSALAGEADRCGTESINNHRTIASLSQQDHFASKYSAALVPAERRAFVKNLLTALLFALNRTHIFFFFAAAYPLSMYFLGDYSPAEIFSAIEACNTSMYSVLPIATYIPELVRGQSSLAVASKMLRIEPRIASENRTECRPEISGKLHVRSVEFGYNNTEPSSILKRVHFKVKPGKTVAIVGSSGCGKSTVLKLIQRFYEPTRGGILIDDHPAGSIDLQHLRSHMAVVSQEPTLFNYTIRENIAYGLFDASEDDVIAAARLANAHDFIVSLPMGYSTMVGERGSLLSGGQRQRIAIARAVIRKPKILLLDEATSALDAESEKLVQSSLECARAGRTCLLIAHSMATVRSADRILVMQNGQIVESGSHRRLIERKGVYAKMCEQHTLTQ